MRTSNDSFHLSNGVLTVSARWSLRYLWPLLGFFLSLSLLCLGILSWDAYVPHYISFRLFIMLRWEQIPFHMVGIPPS